MLSSHIQIKEITSPANHLLKQAKALHERSGRDKSRLFLLEGAKLINEAIERKIEVLDIAVSESFLKQGLPNVNQSKIKFLNMLPDKLFSEFGTTTTPTGIAAIARMPECALDSCLDQADALIVICDSIQDPGNLGTILRTSLAFGADAVVLSKGCVDLYSSKVLRGAMGASFALPVMRDAELRDVIPQIRKHKIVTIALDAGGTKSLFDFDLRPATALILGNEGHGLRGEIAELADLKIMIPMRNQVESLNVGVSATVVLAECARQRNHAPGNRENL
jgi:TrmH family RNA methyltransferase